MARLVLLVSFVVGMTLTSGCIDYQSPGNSIGPATPGPSGNVSPVASIVSPSYAGSSPSMSIIDPPFDGGVLAGNVTVTVAVADFTLVPQGSKDYSGAGHLIYYLDVVPPAVAGIPAVSRPGTYGSSSETNYSWRGILPGTHTFAAQLVNDDDTPLDPPVLDAVDVTAVLPEMIVTT
jgi:hypothetical protein